MDNSPLKLLKCLLLLVIGGTLQILEAQVAVPTFHSMSLYWSPAGGEAGKEVLVSYKRTSDGQWLEGLPMLYNPIEGTTLEQGDYRGSVVHLDPATSYDFRLALQGTSTTADFTMSTWSENFPVDRIVNVADRSTIYNIISGGSPGAYKLYDGSKHTIDVGKKNDYCIRISASYLIVRNINLKGAGISGIKIDPGVHDVVIEGCDISDWGRPHSNQMIPNRGSDYDAGIEFAYENNISRIVIQNNKIHHPTYTTNNSFTNGYDEYTHPEGPQGIVIYNSVGNLVIRYNEIYSDSAHMYNDIIGGGENDSYDGCPGPDTDIYGNVLMNSWDNALEIEGGGQNVRCWNNYMSAASDVIGNASVSIGPFYLWKNVVDKAEWTPGGEPGRFVKMGNAGNESYQTGQIYIFNNTCFQSDALGVGSGIGGGDRITKHCISRNTIIETRGSKDNKDNDFDYDMFNGIAPSGTEIHGLRSKPVYVSGAGFDSRTRTGNFQLSTSSPGYDRGVIIPNFTDGYMDRKPDMGAHENGHPDIQYGVDHSNGSVSTAAPVYSSEMYPEIRVFPNPITSSVNIANLSTQSNISVYTTDGRLVSRKEAYDNTINFNVSNWEKGIYFLRIQSKGHTILEKVVIL